MPVIYFVSFSSNKVLGYPKPVVKWYRSGKEILADGTKIKALEFKGGYYQLVITSADENDATVYQVRATNSSGSISTTANLEVEGNIIISKYFLECTKCMISSFQFLILKKAHIHENKS